MIGSSARMTRDITLLSIDHNAVMTAWQPAELPRRTGRMSTYAAT